MADPARILIFVPNWVGDAVMATPAMRALRRRYKTADCVAVGRPHLKAVFDGTGLVDEYAAWDKRDRARSGFALARRLRSLKSDTAVLFPNSVRVAVMAVASGAGRRIGTARGGRGLLLTDRVDRPGDGVPRPVIDLYNRIAEAAGAEFDGADPYATEAAVTAADRERFRAFRESLGGDLRDDFVVLNSGGAFGAAKDWPVEKFKALAGQIVRELDRDVVVACGPAERDTARAIAAGDNRVFHAADAEPHLGLTKALIKNASLLVTTDSGPRHFAKPFGTPVVTLFGPTHVAWSETFDPRARQVQLPVDCGPCQQRVCPLGHHRCMAELSVERVFGEVVTAVSDHAAEAA